MAVKKDNKVIMNVYGISKQRVEKIWAKKLTENNRNLNLQ